ncbi:MAG: hypothetical protein JWQ90_5480 [Hydrocarboniphaga sp.]|uniref:hypothetical protein n=1 Tax=Hydrocarboniphaga sp. TaxID=2033016 RepID=UPI002621EC7B|nr:hypothetical protein [Hydrocarboniphaga sp.]MDB5973030.1 hypothetical protein [Hydrocarboniphaga sp.]
MDDFHHQLMQWNSFFSSTAQVSGGLVGLVFVALTFKPEALGVAGKAGDSGLRKLARQTFSDFINVLLVSLLMLVPYSSNQIGIALGIVGGLGLWRAIQRIVSVARGPVPGAARGQVMQRFGLSLLGNLFLFAAGTGTVMRLISDLMFWSFLFSSIILLLISGTRTAWLLLMHEADGDA